MSQPANDEFSQHLSDDEASNHEDASDTGAAPKQQQQNGALPLVSMNDFARKVIQNGNSKKRILTGKDGVIRILPPVTAAEIQVVEKERKAKNILLMAIPKEHMRRFHGMDDAKEIWEAIRTRFGGNANSKEIQKAFSKQQFKHLQSSVQKGRKGNMTDSNKTFHSWKLMVLKYQLMMQIISFLDLCPQHGPIWQ
ncbi:hypothetical protein Tco_1046069 [Tanacetum coccineum]